MMLSPVDIEIAAQLVLALVLGALIGFERELKGKEAGLKTYSLVSLGAALFTIVSTSLFHTFSGLEGASFDPGRIVHAVAVGIGFVGAGIIIYRHFHVEGLTTAAGFWMVGAIGVAVGSKLYLTAAVAALLALIILVGFSSLARLIARSQTNKEIM